MSATTLTFEDKTINMYEWQGEQVFVAADVAGMLGYAKSDQIARNLSGRWSDELREGEHFIALRGNPLKAFKESADTLVSGVSRFERTARLLLLTERGAYRVCNLCRSELGVKFRDWLDDVLEDIRNKGYYVQPGHDAASIPTTDETARERNKRLEAEAKLLNAQTRAQNARGRVEASKAAAQASLIRAEAKAAATRMEAVRSMLGMCSDPGLRNQMIAQAVGDLLGDGPVVDVPSQPASAKLVALPAPEPDADTKIRRLSDKKRHIPRPGYVSLQDICDAIGLPKHGSKVGPRLERLGYKADAYAYFIADTTDEGRPWNKWYFRKDPVLNVAMNDEKFIAWREKKAKRDAKAAGGAQPGLS